MTAADLPLPTEWLREPLVARWWNHDTTAEGSSARLRAEHTGEKPGEDLVILMDGERIGLLQRSAIRDYRRDFNEFAAIVDVPDGAVELDYLIGEAARRGRGLGARMIAAVVDDTWCAYPTATAVLVAVVAANTASWCALEKAGLKRIAEGAMLPENPADEPLHFVYRVDRPRRLTTPPPQVTSAPLASVENQAGTRRLARQGFTERGGGFARRSDTCARQRRPRAPSGCRPRFAQTD